MQMERSLGFGTDWIPSCSFMSSLFIIFNLFMVFYGVFYGEVG